MALIHLHNGTYYTDDDMFDSGHGACCECGCPQSMFLEHKICDRCLKPFIVIRAKYLPVHILEHTTKDNLAIRRFKEDAVKMLIQLFEKELSRGNVRSISVCPHQTYLKVYSIMKTGGSPSVKIQLKPLLCPN
jgi:hypothetical protein